MPAHYTAHYYFKEVDFMFSLGARFTDDFYIKVDVASDLSTSVVTCLTEEEGEPVTVTGEITWDEG